MENISSYPKRLSPEQIEATLTALNNRYRREMAQFSDHHADDYEPYEGYPDGKDLYDAHMEMTMKPSLDEQMETPEFKMASLALELTCTRQMIKSVERKLYDTIEAVEFQLSKRMDRMQETIDLQSEALVNHIYGMPDDYDTQRQIEEELPEDFWKREY